MNVSQALCWVFAVAIASQLILTPQAGAQKPTFTVGWSVYAGWNPYFYMMKSGVLRKWADKYGVDIRVQRFDYAASLDSFVAKNIDACTMTNMEALDMPAAAGVDTTVVLIGDYSNGNDAVLTRNGVDFNNIAGHRVMLVQKTVSEYLLERGMTISGHQAQLPTLKLQNTSDSDIAPAFINNAGNDVVVTWKPMVSQIEDGKGVRSIFNSSQIPGEILDLLVIRTEVLNRPDGSGQKFAKAMAGAWYETMHNLMAGGAAQQQVIQMSAAASGDTVESYRNQLKTTQLFTTPQSAFGFATGPTMEDKMDLVRQFCFAHGLLGRNIQSINDVGIVYPNGRVQGRKDKVKLRFDAEYMKAAAEGAL